MDYSKREMYPRLISTVPGQWLPSRLDSAQIKHELLVQGPNYKFSYTWPILCVLET